MITRPLTRSLTSPLCDSLDGPSRLSSYSNLLQYSEQFDNAVWVKTNTTVSADAIAAPDGTTTADKVVETATTAVHKLHQLGITNTPGVVHELVCAFRAAERTKGQLILQDGSFNGVVTNFDLTAGTTSAATTAGTGWSSQVASIEVLADSWYRIRLSGVSSAVATLRGDLLMRDSGGLTSYLGVAGSGMHYWGAMLTRGAGLAYKPRTA